MTSTDDTDPRPLPPEEPGPGECCDSGCDPCVYDLYHEAAFFPFRVPKNVATVFTIHDLSLITLPERHPAERVRYFNRYFHKRLPGVARYLAVSKYT